MMNRVLYCSAGRVLAVILAVLPAAWVQWGGGAAAQADPVTEEQIDETIARLKQILYDLQDPKTGGWFGPYDKGPAFDKPPHDGGESVLATYALLSSGESPQINPKVAKALEYVESLQREHPKEVVGTYVVGVRAHVWSHLPRSYDAALERDARMLLNGTGPRGDYSYQLDKYKLPTGRLYDNSTNQYGVLGVWEAAKRGVKIPRSFWERAAAHVLSLQHKDGGWSYTQEKESSPTMTTAGLTVLYITQQQLARDQDKPNPKVMAAVGRGLEYLDKYYAVKNSNYSGNGYFVYGIERVALASGRSQFGGQDWFDSISNHIVRSVRTKKTDDQIVNSSFYLMFLSRGRVPVTINKLALPDQPWNNRPNDIYYLAKHLTEVFEQEQTWKTIPIGWPVERWLGSPITYLSIDAPLALTDPHKQQIKTYLDMGGLLLVNPEGAGGNRVFKSIEKLGKELYPQLSFKPIEPDHPLLNLWKPVARPPRIMALNDGARDLILVPAADWGMAWQRGPSDRNEDAFNAAGNLLLTATGYSRLAGRSASRYPFPTKTPRGKRRAVAVVPMGGAQADGLWEYLRRDLAKRGIARVSHVIEPVEKLGDVLSPEGSPKTKPDVVHLVGIDAVELSDDAIQRIKKFTKAGGTVLVETLGGKGDFAASIERQLSEAFNQPSERLSSYEPFFAGDEESHTYDISRVSYQVYSVRNFAANSKPRITAIRIDDRPAILISPEDLSLAAMGVRYWGIHGYSVTSARKLLTNLLLKAE